MLLVMIFLLASCKTTKDEDFINYSGVITVQLDERLARIPGITVTGSGASARVTVQGGATSFNGDSAPLYILNEQTITGGYPVVYANVDPNRIKKIKLLKGADASQYGARGGNGVIIITTK